MSSQPSQPATPQIQKLLDLELDALQSMDKIENCDHARSEGSRKNEPAAMDLHHQVSSPGPRPPNSGLLAFDQHGCLVWDLVVERSEAIELGLGFFNGNAHFSMSRQVPAADEKGPETLIVNTIKPGSCLDSWNMVHPRAAVEPFDRITDINGRTTVKEMQEELLNNSVLLIRIVRYPATFDIQLMPPTDGVALLGLRFSPQSYSQQDLSILKVAATGRVEQHNQISIEQGFFHLVVTPGMLVEAINGHCGSARDLQRYLTEAGSGPLQLRMRRSEVSHTLAAKEDPCSASTSAPSTARAGSLTPSAWSRPTTASKSRPTTASKSRPTTANKSRPGTAGRSCTGLLSAFPVQGWKGIDGSEVIDQDDSTPLLIEMSREEMMSPLRDVSGENELTSPDSVDNLQHIEQLQSGETDEDGLGGATSAPNSKQTERLPARVMPWSCSSDHASFANSQEDDQASCRGTPRQLQPLTEGLRQEFLASTPSYATPKSKTSALPGVEIHAGQKRLVPSLGGCLKLEVVLQKINPMDRFGFSHINGAEQFLKARGTRVMDAASSSAQVPPSQAPEVLIIREIAPSGLMAEWNHYHAGSGKQVMLGDRVAAVNGNSSVEAMHEELKTSQRCALSLLRYPPRFIAKLPGLSSQRKSLGLKFESIGHGCTALRIADVARDGLVEEYNQFHQKHGRFHLVITRGMVILSVNQAQGSSELMLRVLSQAPSLMLLISRPE